MTAQGRNVLVRALAAVLVVGGAIGVYEYLSRPGIRDQPFRRIAGVVAWEKARNPFWESLQYGSLSDRARISHALTSAAGRSRALSNLEINQRQGFADTASLLFFSLAASDPEEYLQRVKPLRKLRAAPQEDGSVLLNYSMLMGRAMPSDLTSQAALDIFWNAMSKASSRPVSVSAVDPRGIAFSTSIFDGQKDRDWVTEEGHSEVWGNPASTSLVKITVPVEESAATLRKDGNLLHGSIDTVFKTGSGKCVPIHVSMFWSTISSRWLVEFVSTQTDEKLLWPI